MLKKGSRTPPQANGFLLEPNLLPASPGQMSGSCITLWWCSIVPSYSMHAIDCFKPSEVEACLFTPTHVYPPSIQPWTNTGLGIFGKKVFLFGNAIHCHNRGIQGSRETKTNPRKKSRLNIPILLHHFLLRHQYSKAMSQMVQTSLKVPSHIKHAVPKAF